MFNQTIMTIQLLKKNLHILFRSMKVPKKAAPFQNKIFIGMGRLEEDMDINRF